MWVLAGVLLAGGSLPYLFWLQNRDKQGSGIPVSGNIEVTTVEVAFKIPGKIENLPVEEGDYIQQGQLIASLEHRDLLAQKSKAEATLEATRSNIPTFLKNIELQDQATQQEISQANAAVEAARARLQQLLAGSRPQEIQQAKAILEQAEADLTKRKADVDRAQKLYQSNFISAQDWDTAKNAHEGAAASYKKARENYALVV
jgi:HlyD family secretion protein